MERNRRGGTKRVWEAHRECDREEQRDGDEEAECESKGKKEPERGSGWGVSL